LFVCLFLKQNHLHLTTSELKIDQCKAKQFQPASPPTENSWISLQSC